jgi:hypothetical protein
MVRIFLILLVLSCIGAAPATRPATAPATPARVRDGLVNGSIRFLVSADWEIDERGESGLAVKYKLPDDRGSITVLVNQQAQGIPQDNAGVRRQITQVVLAAHNEDLKKLNAEVIDAPAVEPDGRFMLKIHARYRDGHGYHDEVHVYRALGINFVGVSASASSEDKKEAKAVHDAGALVLMSVAVGPPDKKIPRAKEQQSVKEQE